MDDLREKIWRILIGTCEDASGQPGKEADWLTDQILAIPEIASALEASGYVIVKRHPLQEEE